MNHEKPTGSIKLIIGPMFSNKTMTLITTLERYYYAKKRCIIIKHTFDTRYDSITKRNGIVCNNLIEYNLIPTVSGGTLAEIDVAPYDVIGITESQFFDDLLIVDKWANDGKIIVCDGLDGDYHKDTFGKIHLLIPKCEQVIKLNAVCMICGNDAAFTARKSTSTNIIEIGGADKYYPTCRKCHNV